MVAKDFGISTKEVTEILTQYSTAPKSSGTALDERQLSLIFEYLCRRLS